MKKKLLIFSTAVAFLASLFLPAFAYATNYNQIIDDAVFDNYSSMSAGQIDSFLNSFPQSCISLNNGFTAPDVVGYSPSTSFQYGNNVSAGTVIYHAAQAYGINPQVLIVTLQKEQGLVVGDGGNVIRNSSDPTDCGALAISASMGYNCPDTMHLTSYSGFTLYAHNGTPITSVNNTCVEHAAYVGFSRQVIIAAWQFTFDRHRSEGQNNWYDNKPGWDNSDDLGFCYSGRDVAGGPYYLCPDQDSHTNDPYITHSGQYPIDNIVVTIQNGATAAFYNYTPHLHGQDLFTNFFTSWFGSTQAIVPYTNLKWQYESLSGNESTINQTNSTVGMTPASITFNNNLYVFSYNATNQDLELAMADNSGWHFSVLDGTGGTNGRIQANVGMKTTPIVYNNELHIFYYDATDHGLRHGWFDGAAWTFESLDGSASTITGHTTSDVGNSSTAAAYILNNSSTLQLFYYDATNGNLRHAWFDNTNWQFENLEGDYGSISHFNSNIGQDTKAVQYGNSLQLLYYDVQYGNLRHGWFDPASGWHFENLEGDVGSISHFDANIGLQPAIVMDGSIIQAFYYDWQHGNLRHSWFDPNNHGWHFENLEGDVGSISHFDVNIGQVPVALYRNNVLYVFYRNESAGQLRGAWADASGWHFATMDGTVNSVTTRTANTGFNPTATIYGGSLQLYYFDNTGRALYHQWGIDR